ncbi:MAG: hypothetical protein OYG31_03205 [Candidatus Kaiserbacteria bacterium]|nr:hypothetical protein [Candidatus Kaiserbacteria bacterium]
MNTNTKQDEKEKFTITYSNGALKTLDEMTQNYQFKDREQTLNFALYLVQKLYEDGNVELKDRYGKRD